MKIRIESLKRLASNMQPIYYLNTALIDHKTNAKRIKAKSEILQFAGKTFKLVNRAEHIKNISRLRIAFLMPIDGDGEWIRNLLGQADKLAFKGHDVLLYSYWPKPDWFQSKARYFEVCPESILSDVIANADIVLACSWYMVVDALNITAPIKYLFAGKIDVIDKYSTLSEEMQKVVSAAFILPFKILTFSNECKSKIKQLFKRNSVLLTKDNNFINGQMSDISMLLNNSDHHTIENLQYENDIFYAIEKEFNRSLRSTIQAIEI
ncbi:MAG: hypothetical protein N2645_03505 [Clostridia bacterium]|nr:hypothetical protein [Clostridia bacterium]